MSDPQNHAQSIREGLHIFANRILGPNTLIQKALPGILKGTDGDWFKGVLKKLEVSLGVELVVGAGRYSATGELNNPNAFCLVPFPFKFFKKKQKPRHLL